LINDQPSEDVQRRGLGLIWRLTTSGPRSDFAIMATTAGEEEHSSTGAGVLWQGGFGDFEHVVTFTPPGYSGRDDWPLLIYLHGASTRGDIHRLASSHGGFVRHLHPGAALAALPMVVVAPLCDRGTEWAAPGMCERVHRLVDVALETFNVASKPFVTGNSMGGLGSYMLVVRDPDPLRWAGAIPVCGGGHPVFAKLAAGVSFWFFHAASDKVVAVEDTDKLVEALRQAGAAEVRYTRYAEAPDPDVEDYCEGHNAWDEAWARTPALWKWVESLVQKKRAPRTSE
jgi:predicted peptidase